MNVIISQRDGQLPNINLLSITQSIYIPKAQIPNITLSTGVSTSIDLANYYTSNSKPKSYSLSIADTGDSYTKNGNIVKSKAFLPKEIINQKEISDKLPYSSYLLEEE